MTKHIRQEQTELLSEYADFMLATGNAAIRKKGRFNLVLSGGSTPKALFALLTTPDYSQKIDWDKVFFFFGDERYVPADDEDYNGLMAGRFLFEPLDIGINQIFLVDTSLSPAGCAAQYEAEIKAHFGNEPPAFDFIMLGLGADAHTASLFPGTAILTNKEVGIRPVLIKEGVWRISMTAALINQSKEIAFLSIGESKAEAMAHVLASEYNPTMYPAQLIRPENGNLHWFVDEAAAALLHS